MRDASLICIGMNHRTAPVGVREQFSCSPRHIYRAWAAWPHDLAERPSEIAFLATCNRVELYARFQHAPDDPAAVLTRFLSSCEGRTFHEVQPHMVAVSGADAAAHLCRVAAGLESQVLGEDQILGQVKEAYSVGIESGTIGPYLSALFNSAIRVGKRARAETAISQNPVSLSSTAIAAAQQIFPDLVERSVLVIGAGEMAELAVKGLIARGVRQITVANRSPERGARLAALTGGAPVGLDALPALFPTADVVISATGAPRPLIDRATLEATPRAPDRPLLLIDIALPRDIDPAVRELPGIRLMDLDDLKRQQDSALAMRHAEAPRVLEIIAQEQLALENQLELLGVRAVITELRQKAEQIRQRELERALRHLGPIDAGTERHIELFSRALMNKLLHDPTAWLREKAGSDDLAESLETVRALFALKTDDP